MADRIPAVLALTFYVAHALELVLRFPAANLLWSCNVASLLVVLGLFARHPLANAVGCFMFIPGNLFWVLDLLAGGELLPTSPLTHIGVFLLSIAGVRRLGLPRATWWATLLGIALATLAARLVGPASENVNLAFHIPRGWEWRWPSHGVYLLTLTLLFAAGSLTLQALLRRLGVPTPSA